MKECRTEKNRGSVMVEAVISLSAFMFAIVMILTIVNICIIQAKMAIAVNSAAKEISQYSYLYSLTGFQASQSRLYEAGVNDVSEVSSIATEVNTVFNAISGLSGTLSGNMDSVDDITSGWDDLVGSAEQIKESGASVMSSLESIAEDPMGVIFGMAKLAASDTFDFTVSRLIAAPISAALCKKHLISEEGGDVEGFLKAYHVVPDAGGSYFGGLDFTESSFFPHGSNQITVRVSYDVNVVNLLPINKTFHFTQTATTTSWLAGDVSYTPMASYVETGSLWTTATVEERSAYIRKLGMMKYKDQGYYAVSGISDLHMYNPSAKDFVIFKSMNPLYSDPSEDPVVLNDVSDAAIREQIERMCGKAAGLVDGRQTVPIKTVDAQNQNTKEDKDCANATVTIVLTVPEDEGLKDHVQEIISQSATKGVNIVLNASFGKGVNKEIASDSGNGGQSGGEGEPEQ